jgi:hypothetical protein
MWVSKPGDAGVAMGVAMYDDGDQFIVWNVNLQPSGSTLEEERYWGHYFLYSTDKSLGMDGVEVSRTRALAEANAEYERKRDTFIRNEYLPYIPYLAG